MSGYESIPAHKPEETCGGHVSFKLEFFCPLLATNELMQLEN